MLDRPHRFHGHGSLRFIYRNGKYARNRYLQLRFIPNKRRNKDRFAVVVSKKTMKSAVGRNRIRRRIFEVIRHELPHLQAQHDVVITVYSADFAIMPHATLKRQIVGLFKQADLYK